MVTKQVGPAIEDIPDKQYAYLNAVRQRAVLDWSRPATNEIAVNGGFGEPEA
jgi:hypothetical protein